MAKCVQTLNNMANKLNSVYKNIIDNRAIFEKHVSRYEELSNIYSIFEIKVKDCDYLKKAINFQEQEHNHICRLTDTIRHLRCIEHLTQEDED